MANCTLPLEPIVPNSASIVEATSPTVIVIQALPTAVCILVWLSLGLRRRTKWVHRTMITVSKSLALLAVAASALLSWHVIDLLACEDLLETPRTWQILIAAGIGVVGLGIVLGLSTRLPRLSIALSFLVASAAVVVDVGLRGWWVSPPATAAFPLVSVQQLWDLIAVCLLVCLPPTRRVPLPKSISVVPTGRKSNNAPPSLIVDSLATRRTETPPVEASSWSFW